MQHQLVLLDRPAQISDEREVMGDHGVMLDGVDLVAAVSALGRVHRHVRSTQERHGVRAMLGPEGDADTPADVQVVVLDREWLLQRLEQLARDQHRPGDVGPG